jgi:hypothetical protein
LQVLCTEVRGEVGKIQSLTGLSGSHVTTAYLSER